MPAFKNQTGKRFGRLVVLERVQRRSRRAYWRCRCDCGNVIVRTNIVAAKSCGCARIEGVRAANKDRTLPDSAFKAVLCLYKGNATSRGLKWELSDEQFRALTLSPCFYTGRLPATVRYTNANPDGIYIHNGIDRLDNSKGYTMENCVPCCHDVNYLKSAHHYDKFIELCLEVAAHMNKKPLTAAPADQPGRVVASDPKFLRRRRIMAA